MALLQDIENEPYNTDHAKNLSIFKPGTHRSLAGTCVSAPKAMNN